MVRMALIISHFAPKIIGYYNNFLKFATLHFSLIYEIKFQNRRDWIEHNIQFPRHLVAILDFARELMRMTSYRQESSTCAIGSYYSWIFPAK